MVSIKVINQIEQIASNQVLEDAFAWLCRSRKDHSHNSDVWELRRNWEQEKENIKELLLLGRYQFDTLREIRSENEIIELWRSRDAVVLKAMTIVLEKQLRPKLSPRCFHVKGRGGIKKALQDVRQKMDETSFVMKSDVKSYYASINHELLFEMVKTHIQDERVWPLVWQYLRRTVVYGENYREVNLGISLRCSLLPRTGSS